MGFRLTFSFVLALTLASTAFAAELGRDGRRLKVALGNRAVVVEAYSDSIVHIEATANGRTLDVNRPLYTTPMIASPALKNATVTLRQNGLSTRDLDVSVDAQSLCVSVVDTTKAMQIVRNCPFNLENDWKGITIESPGFSDVYGLGNYFKNFGTADGNWIGHAWDPGMGTHGNNMHAFGEGAPSYAMFPIMYALGEGTNAYALFLDSVYKQMWSFNSAPWRVEMWGDQIRWYVISGRSVAELRKSYLALTGAPPIPPKKVLGLWVSEFGFENWAEAYKPVVSLRQNGFPLDGLGMDLQWFGGSFFGNGADTRGSRMGTLEFDPVKFANFEHEVRHLRKDRGVNLMLIEESYVSSFLGEHRDLNSRGLLAHRCGSSEPTFLSSNPWWGVGGMIDWTNPKAGDYWHDRKRQALYRLCITDHWTDLGEPEMYDASACYYGFPEIGKRGHGDIHNIYNFKWHESILRGYERNKNRLRPYMMARSGTSGIQRFGAGLWSGDLAANMGTMAAHYASQTNMTMSGIDFFSSDIGGFHRNERTLDGDPEELFTQWFANASLFDFPVRPHVNNLSKQYKTSPDAIGHVASNRFNIHQRYALSPYYYSLAYRASRFGEPVVPPMMFAFQADKNVRKMGNQKMIGPFLMGAIVARYGEIDRGVYLPKGKWTNFHTGDVFESQGEMLNRVPTFQDGVFRPPLFARAGAILPMMHVDSKTMNVLGRRDGEAPSTALKVRVYPDETASSFELYEDDGETIDYKDGKAALTMIRQKRTGSTVEVTIEATRGRYAGLPESREAVIEIALDGEKAVSVEVGGVQLPACTGLGQSRCWKRKDSKRVVVKTGVSPIGVSRTVRVSLANVERMTSVYLVCSNGQTTNRTSVYVSGDVAELGAMDPAKAVKLAPTSYPTWSAVVQVPASRTIKWKCLKKTDQGQVVQTSSDSKFTSAPQGYSGLFQGEF